MCAGALRWRWRRKKEKYRTPSCAVVVASFIFPLGRLEIPALQEGAHPSLSVLCASASSVGVLLQLLTE